MGICVVHQQLTIGRRCCSLPQSNRSGGRRNTRSAPPDGDIIIPLLSNPKKKMSSCCPTYSALPPFPFVRILQTFMRFSPTCRFSFFLFHLPPPIVRGTTHGHLYHSPGAAAAEEEVEEPLGNQVIAQQRESAQHTKRARGYQINRCILNLPSQPGCCSW